MGKSYKFFINKQYMFTINVITKRKYAADKQY